MKKYAPLVLVVLLLACIAGGVTYAGKLSKEARDSSNEAMARGIEITSLKTEISTLKRQHESDLKSERATHTRLLAAADEKLREVQAEREAMRTKLEASRTGKVADPRVPTGSTLSVDEINLREVRQSSSYIYYAWTAKIGNPLAYTKKANTRICMYDEKGFLLENSYGDEQNIPSLSYTVLSGSGMVEKRLWDQVDRYRVELK